MIRYKKYEFIGAKSLRLFCSKFFKVKFSAVNMQHQYIYILTELVLTEQIVSSSFCTCIVVIYDSIRSTAGTKIQQSTAFAITDT